MRVHEQRAEKFMNTMDPGDIGFGMWEKDNSSEQWTDPGPNLHLAFETKDIGVRVQLGRLSWRINPLRSGLHDNENHGSRVQKSRGRTFRVLQHLASPRLEGRQLGFVCVSPICSHGIEPELRGYVQRMRDM